MTKFDTIHNDKIISTLEQDECRLRRVLCSGNSDNFLDSFGSCGGCRLQLQCGQLGP